MDPTLVVTLWSVDRLLEILFLSWQLKTYQIAIRLHVYMYHRRLFSMCCDNLARNGARWFAISTVVVMQTDGDEFCSAGLFVGTAHLHGRVWCTQARRRRHRSGALRQASVGSCLGRHLICKICQSPVSDVSVVSWQVILVLAPCVMKAKMRGEREREGRRLHYQRRGGGGGARQSRKTWSLCPLSSSVSVLYCLLAQLISRFYVLYMD